MRHSHLLVQHDVPHPPEFPVVALDNLLDGKVVNRIAVPEPIRSEVKVALDRTLSIT